jgi:carboxyl-terminal processing protease
MKKFLFCLLFCHNFVFWQSAVKADPNFDSIAMHVAYMLQNHHYSRQDFDDSISTKLLQDYLNVLDVKHIMFTQKEVDTYKENYGTTLDDHILMSNIQPALEIYKLYRERMVKRVAFTKKVLQENVFTHQTKKEYTIDREKSPYPQDLAGLEQAWTVEIEESLLEEKLQDYILELNPEKSKITNEKKSPNQRVKDDYDRMLKMVVEKKSDEICNDFLSALAAAFDPHTEYMGVQEVEGFEISMKNKLYGIGAMVGVKDDMPYIQGIVVGGPADKQGELRLKDKILGVAQEGETEFVDTKYLKLNDVVSMIRGPERTKVRLKIQPAENIGEVKIIQIERAEVQLKDKNANAEIIDTPKALGGNSRIGWLNLSAFYGDMNDGNVSPAKDIHKLLTRLIKENIEGLVFDLRGNGGGSLDEVIKIAGLFLPAGPVVQIKDWRGNIYIKNSEPSHPVYKGPLIVLTDKTSASASEIFAAVIQDTRRGIIVGDKSTYGKGTVQTILEVQRYMPFFSNKEKAGALKVTVQKFYRIAGGSTQLKGVEPDLVLPNIRDVLEIGEDKAPNAMPYDFIPTAKFNYWQDKPIDFKWLKNQVFERIEKNKEFEFIIKEADLLKERLDKNVLSMQIDERKKEVKENQDLRNNKIEVRKKLTAELVELLKVDPVKVYQLTLENYSQPELPLKTDDSYEKMNSMKIEKNEDDDTAAENKFPYGMDPVKVESIRVMNDYLNLLRKEAENLTVDKK